MPAKFDRMQKDIKKQLKKDNPKMSNDEAERRSYAIAVSQWKKSHGGKSPFEDANSNVEEISNEKYDEEGHLIVYENTKFLIDGDITSIEE